MEQGQDTAAKATDTYPLEHSRVEVRGIDVVHTTHRDPRYWQGEFVWVGVGGEGRLLTPAQARDIAAAIVKAAVAAEAREQAASARTLITPRIAAYAKVHGKTPAEAVKEFKSIQHMRAFGQWVNARVSEWLELNGRDDFSEADHAAFDQWLQAEVAL